MRTRELRMDGLRCDLAAADERTLEALVALLPALCAERPRLGGRTELAGWDVRGKGGPLAPGPARRHGWRARLGRRPPPRRAEHENLLWLRRRLFRAPEPRASLVLWDGGRPVGQWLWVAWWADHESLEARWPALDDAERHAILDELADEVARWHALHFTHQDLFPRNVLVGPRDADRRLGWIDAWAGGVGRRGRGPAADLGCLFLEGADTWTADQQERWLRRYLDRRARQGAPADPRRLLPAAAAARDRLRRRLVRQPERLHGRPLPTADWDPLGTLRG